jgi:hypothetical protein
MDWIDLAEDRDHWRALVNTVMNLRFHKMFGSSWVAAQLAASQEGLSSMSEWGISWQEGYITEKYTVRILYSLTSTGIIYETSESEAELACHQLLLTLDSLCTLSRFYKISIQDVSYHIWRTVYFSENHITMRFKTGLRGRLHLTT